jgi:hypothetical protein
MYFQNKTGNDGLNHSQTLPQHSHVALIVVAEIFIRKRTKYIL